MNQNPTETFHFQMSRNNFYILSYYVIILHNPLMLVEETNLFRMFISLDIKTFKNGDPSSKDLVWIGTRT